jgi:DNA-binding NtrC family response regulator
MMQIALLRILEEGEVRPLGDSTTRSVDVRVIAATARDLGEEVVSGRFREDLFHRLNVIRVDLPPLRDRKEDIPLLVEHLGARMLQRPNLHPDASRALIQHDWPGNVRELENVLRACAVVADGGEITPELLRGILLQGRARARAQGRLPGSIATPREREILRRLGQSAASAPEIASFLGVSTRTANRDLARLVSASLVTGTGEARARRYHRAVSP